MPGRTALLVIVAILFLPSLLSAARPVPNSPGDARLFTVDIDHFWEAYDAMSDGDSLGALETLYLDRATPGLDDFVRARIGSAGELLSAIDAYPRYYASLRGPTAGVAAMQPAIRASFQKLEDLYADAHFPDVYFVIGRLSSGGTTSEAGLLIGADMYGLTDATPMDELNDWLRQVLKPAAEIPHIVAHELVHFQQPSIPQDRRTLLAACVREGSADFVAELISGRHINAHVHEYCLPREAELWAEFETAMNGSDYSGWLYGGQPEGRPADIGYFIGYRIAQAYYGRSEDKTAALRDILLVEDFPAFLEASGYNP